MTNSPRIQAGGTLLAASLYVSRLEDVEFLEYASEPKAWINVYGCRTMGKSSLCIRHRERLAALKIKVAFIDIAARVGNVHRTGIDWVRGLGAALASELHLESDVVNQALSNVPDDTPIGPALEQMLVNGFLPRCEGSSLLVLDEYDYIRDLDYCNDILYGLRHLQSIHARSDILDRLSICLVGLEPLTLLGKAGAANASPLAAPIEMHDFEPNESTLTDLQRAFPANQSPSRAVLNEVFNLSGGQPLVTMQLLRHVKSRQCNTPDAVHKLAEELVAPSGLGNDLQFFGGIERNVVAQGGDAFATLRAYESLLQDSREAHTAPGSDLLQVLGLVRRKEGRLEIKGDLFRRRFDGAWVQRMLSRAASAMQQHRGKVASEDETERRVTDRKHYRGGSGKICVINTGGTLGMVERGDKIVPPRNAEEFKEYFTSLGSVAGEVEFINLFPPRDSINVFPDQWCTIARYIYNRRHEGFDGFVVAHGTDTMAYSASAVAFALGPQLRFPIVFTGAQTTPDVAFGDAHVNLYRACEVAKKPIPEVVISFGNFVYRAVRAQKRDDRRFDGFESPTYPPLAEITGEINVRRELLRPLPKKIVDIELHDEFEESVLIVPQFPGLEPDFFEHLLQENSNQHGCRGVIVQTLGAGNVTSEPPYTFIPFVARAYQLGIPIIVTSQYPPDPGTHTKYTPAEAPIKAGAIHAGNMTLAAAVVKFRWVLAQVRRRGDWLQMRPARKKELVSRLMVGNSVIGEF